MNWTKVLAAGLVVGILMNVVDYVMHGLIMAETYTRYPVFTQEAANPVWFFVVSIVIWIFVAILFAKTRPCWGEGYKGGAVYGFWLGMVAFFSQFYNPLVLEGFPYYLAWCWGGIVLIVTVLGGAILGVMIKRS